MAPTTRERILQSAEKLFAERGYEATSLRTLTAEAGVNLAAVHYHFRSKEALIQEIFTRRLDPLNASRIALLDECERASRNGTPDLESIIEALVSPVLRIGREQDQSEEHFKKLMGRMFAEPSRYTRNVFDRHLREVARRFTAALRRALPDLPPEELFWRLHFSIGAMAHTLAGGPLLEIVSDGRCNPREVESTIRRLVAFVVAGLRAPLPPDRDPGAGRRKRKAPVRTRRKAQG